MGKGFIFTGMAFLLIVPAVILVASYIEMIRYGEEGRILALESDIVYYISWDLRETIVNSAENSGRWEAYQATALLINTYESLAGNYSIDYAVEHSWFTDPEVNTSNSSRVIEDNIIASINEALKEVMKNYSVAILLNNGNNITDDVLSLYQTDPWGFYVRISELPLVIQGTKAIYNTTIPAINVYVSIEGLSDPYIFIKTRGRSSNRIYRTNYTPIDERYDESTSDSRLYQLYNVLIGSGRLGTPRPFYHAHNASGSEGGICFFCRLDGKTASDCPHTSAKMETFIVGDPLSKSNVSVVDHYYFTDILGSGITVSGAAMEVPSASPNTYDFLIDDTHLAHYDLNRAY
jgi:hypothetical protein